MSPVSKMSDAKHCFYKTCGKRLSLLEQSTYTCSKCNHTYCTLHRLAENHACPYDFKNAVNKEKFILDNKCVAEKIQQI